MSKEKRLFDRHNYANRTIEIYEILSAYYVDIFYNHLYTEAKKLKANGSVASITEGYKHTLNAFLKGLNNPKLYKKSLTGIHHYFINIGLASITFSRCIDKITREFIPTDYFSSLSATQKMGVLRMVLGQSIRTFIRKIVDEHMVKIIDNHKDQDNVRILQDALIDCFILEREGMYQRFVAKQTTTNKDDVVNKLVAEKMQSEIKKLIKEKYEYKKQIVQLVKLYKLQKSTIDKQKKEIEALRSQVHNLNGTVSKNYADLALTRSQLVRHNNDFDDNKSMIREYSKPDRVNNNTEFKHATDRQVRDTDQQTQYDDDKFKKSNSFQKQAKAQKQVKFQMNSNSNTHDSYANDKVTVEDGDDSNSDTGTLDDDPNSLSSMLYDNGTLDNGTLDNGTLEDSDHEETGDNIEKFVEVNSSNINTILNGDSEYLQHLNDSRKFNSDMDQGTTLDDFS